MHIPLLSDVATPIRTLLFVLTHRYGEGGGDLLALLDPGPQSTLKGEERGARELQQEATGDKVRK